MKMFRFIVSVVIAMFVFGAEIRFILIVAYQKEAESFSQTGGTVISSQVVERRGRRSTSYRALITYSYQVNGQFYQSQRYRYDDHPNTRQAVYDLVADHPAGSVITVYYDPKNLVDAVLSAGVDVGDVDIVFFFAAICLFLLAYAPQVDWPWPSPVAGGAKVITEGMVTRVRLPQYKVLTIVGAVAAGLSGVAGILTMFCFQQVPPLVVGGWLLLAVLSGSAATYAWCFLRERSGRLDLVIDEGSRTVQLPRTYKRREQSPLPFARVKSVVLDKIKHKTKSGAYYTYAVTLKMTGDTLERLAIMYESRADSLGALLKEKLHISSNITILNDEPED